MASTLSERRCSIFAFVLEEMHIVIELIGDAQSQRCDTIHDPNIERLRVLITWDTDTQISRVPENFEYIWCIDVNTRKYWQNSGIHVNASNVFKIFVALGNLIVSTRNIGYYDISPHNQCPSIRKIVESRLTSKTTWREKVLSNFCSDPERVALHVFDNQTNLK